LSKRQFANNDRFLASSFVAASYPGRRLSGDKLPTRADLIDPDTEFDAVRVTNTCDRTP
jgi:hypothetical protein